MKHTLPSQPLKGSLPPQAVILHVVRLQRLEDVENDDKALLESYEVLQEGILCDVYSQKCPAAWQDARGERLTVGCQAAKMQMTG